MIKTSRRQYLIEENIAAFYAVELINMVYRLHQCHVIHGDIKPDNVMIMDIRYVLWNKYQPTCMEVFICNYKQ